MLTYPGATAAETKVWQRSVGDRRLSAYHDKDGRLTHTYRDHGVGNMTCAVITLAGHAASPTFLCGDGRQTGAVGKSVVGSPRCQVRVE
jgi:hypothetical protein